MNKCEICGKFRKWKELIPHFTPDTPFNSEDSWFECKKCLKKERLKDEKQKIC